MNVNCKECNSKYHIPDYQLDDRRVYFFCEKCNHRIVIDRQRESWSSYKGLSSSVLSAKNILEGIFFSFNLKNIRLSFYILIIFILFLSSISFLVYKNISFFSRYPAVTGILSFVILLILTIIYDIHLYMLSKNFFYRIHNDSNIKFSDVKHEIYNDLKPIYILSIGLTLLFVILLIPIIFLNKHLLLYTGILYPFFIFLSAIIMLVLTIKNIIFAFIASRSRSTGYTFKSIIRFIAVENINIPFYTFLTNVITSIIAGIIIFFISTGISITSFAVFKSMGTQIFSEITRSISSSPAEINSLITNGILSMQITARVGIILILFFTLIIILLSVSYLINLTQSLSTASVYIMETNPGMSVSKNVVIFTLIVIFIIPLFAGILLFL